MTMSDVQTLVHWAIVGAALGPLSTLLLLILTQAYDLRGYVKSDIPRWRQVRANVRHLPRHCYHNTDWDYFTYTTVLSVPVAVVVTSVLHLLMVGFVEVFLT